VATMKRPDVLRMPRPCAVELHACGYNETSGRFADATALRRGASRLWLQWNVRTFCGCHGLVPWSFTLVATMKRPDVLRKLITKSINRETPRRKAVASWGVFAAFFVVASVKLHGARPWHLREFLQLFLAASVKPHGARPWHPSSFNDS